MEILVYPRGFTILNAKIPQQSGEPADAMTVVIIDAGGTAVKAIFGMQDWANFQEAVADPAGFAARAKARSRIIAPGGMAPSLKTKH